MNTFKQILIRSRGDREREKRNKLNEEILLYFSIGKFADLCAYLNKLQMNFE